MTTDLKDNTAIVIVAHGDRGGRERNGALLSHADYLRRELGFSYVEPCVLNGEPEAEEVFEKISEKQIERVLVYPFFMSDGYFVDRVLPAKIDEAGLTGKTRVIEPLGLDPGLPELFMIRILEVARAA